MSGPITKALDEAMALRKQYIDGGMAPAEADRIVGQAMKAVLGHRRLEPWRFYCEHCKDTGWITVMPSPEGIARLVKLYGEAYQPQGYVVKCEPCKWTQREREKRRKKAGETHDADDLAAAGQTKRGFRKLA